MIVALEGIDACGKETQCRLLAETADPESVRSISFPAYDTEVGHLIKRELSKDDRDPLLLQSLMLANRMELQLDIREYEKDVYNLLILDRYWLSAVVYGTYDGLDPRWIVRSHRCLVQPDLWVILDITAEESFRRRPVREDVYESDLNRLDKVASLYRHCTGNGAKDLAHPLIDSSVAMIDGMQDSQEVHRQILDAVERASL